MASQQFFHEITIACEPEAVFDYVTDPSHWHEWFSASLPSRVDVDPRNAGSTFQVTLTQRPLRSLPVSLLRPIECVVCKSDRPYLWEVEAHSDLVDAITSYTLSRTDEGTVFKRQFRYTPKEWLRYVEPLLFRRRIVRQALQSLEKLKTRLEQGSAEQGCQT